MIEWVGASTESREKSATAAAERASKSLQDLGIAEIAFSQKVKGLLLPRGGVNVTLILHGSDGRQIEKTITADR